MKGLWTGALLALAASAHAQPETTETKELEEMLVVASRLPSESYTVGRSVSVLDQTRIRDLGYSYGADLFRFVPGVAVSRAGGYGGLTQLRLRGAEANHVVVLLDGIDVSAAGSGEFDFSSLLSADIERIEVLKGPQSGLYGSNALAGVISIHTRSPQPGFGVDLNLEAGRFDTRHGAISISGGSDRIQGRLNYVERRSEFDLSTNDAVIGSEDDEDVNKTISGQLLLAVNESLSLRGFARLNDKETDTDGFDFSGGPQQGLPIDDLSTSETEDQTFGLVARLNLAGGRSISRLALERTDTELDGGSFGSESERREIKLDSSWQWRDLAQTAQRTTFFLQREEESFRNLFPFDPSQRATQERDLFGFGIEHRIEVDDRLFINAALRRDNGDDFSDETTYSLDLAYLVNEGNTRLHASYGRGITNPTFFEQFGFVPGTFVGNPNLSPEESIGWDVGVEQTLGAWRFDLTYFDADLQDEIQSAFPSVANVAGQSDRKGVEVVANFQPNAVTAIDFAYTYTDTQQPGGEGLRRPEHVASLSVATGLLDGRLTLAGSAVYNGDQLDSDFRNFFVNGFVAEQTTLDSYVLVNASATYQLTEGIAVYLRLENLFDENYEELLGYATPGRAALAGVRIRFGR